jgi:hypothetical protein
MPKAKAIRGSVSMAGLTPLVSPSRPRAVDRITISAMRKIIAAGEAF